MAFAPESPAQYNTIMQRNAVFARGVRHDTFVRVQMQPLAAETSPLSLNFLSFSDNGGFFLALDTD